MNYNILAYGIYIPIIFFITIWVGQVFYSNGKYFLIGLLENNIQLVNNLNKLLLTGYYLVNLGYAIITISYWDSITNDIELIHSLSNTLGKLIIILAILHYNNIAWLKYLTHRNILK